MRCFLLPLAACCLLFACSYHEFENPAERQNTPSTLPTGGAEWQYNPRIENHYNLLLQEIFNNCDEKPLDDSRVVWDVVSFDKKTGRLTFDDQTPLYPWEVEFEIDDEKKFKKTIETEKLVIGKHSYILKLEVGGQFFSSGLTSETGNPDALTSEAKFYVFYSDNPEVEPKYSCHQTLLAHGQKRYAEATQPSIASEGEYKVRTKVLSNDCPKEKFPKTMSATVMPQEGGAYYLRLHQLYLGDLAAIGGKIDEVQVATRYESYIFSGKIGNPLSLDVRHFGPTGCSGHYEITGQKRFEEAAEPEKLIDGIYSVVASITEETTCNRPLISERFHLDAVQINGHRARILIGGKDFIAEIYADQSFKASFTADNSKKPAIPFIGTITPDAVAGTMKLTISNLVAATSCDIFYSISGQKLYKHY